MSAKAFAFKLSEKYEVPPGALTDCKTCSIAADFKAL